MPVLEEAIVDYLGPELSSLVSDRLVPMRGEEGIGLPYVTYQRISAVRDNDHDPFGTMKAWVSPRIQFTCWDRTMLGAIIVGDAVVEALNGYNGMMGSLSVGYARVVFELDDYQEDVKLYRRIVDVVISHQEGGGS
jgi:hypothetical protein